MALQLAGTPRSPWISKHTFFHTLHRLCVYIEVISDKEFLCVWMNYKSSQKKVKKKNKKILWPHFKEWVKTD